MNSSEKNPETGAVVTDAFNALRAGPERGRTWADRAAVLAQVSRTGPLSFAGSEAVVNAAVAGVAQLKPGQRAKHGAIHYELVSLDDIGGLSVRIHHETTSWGVTKSISTWSKRFTVTQTGDEGSRILSSGSWTPSRDGGIHIVEQHCGDGNFIPLSRLAVLVNGTVPRKKPVSMHRSDPTAAVLEADGGVPGVNSRALLRMLSEDTASRVLSWGGRLFDATARMYASEGVVWGQEALRWAINVDARFPSPDGKTGISCLLPREGRDTVAAVFRRAQPNLETQTYLVWRENTSERGPLNLLSVDEEAVDDIETFIQAGAVPSVSYDPSSGAVRLTERAISSGVVECFANQIGEAWSVLSDLPLYAAEGERPTMTDDFSVFDRVEPWTKRGRKLGAAKALSEGTVLTP